MAKKRNYYRYKLKQRGKIVYIGITNNPICREEEHRQEGKDFSKKMHIIRPAVSKETAEQREQNSLESYMKSHQGKNPKYNETNK